MDQWCKIDESIYVAEADEQYKQFGGFKYNENTLENLSRLKIYNSNLFMESFSEPRSLVTTGIENIANSKTIKLYLELYKERNSKIISATELINNSPVNWSSWRQFNSIEKRPEIRKKVFDEFIIKTIFISPLVEERFSKIKESYEDSKVYLKSSSSNQINPLSVYLEHENITYEQLTDFIKTLGNVAKKPFKEYLSEISQKLFDKEPEYYDDFYFYRNKVYSKIENDFLSINPVEAIKKVLKNLDFDLSRIHFDTENRNNKYISPVCIFVKIPKILEFYTRMKVLILIFKLVFMNQVMQHMLHQ